MIGIENIALISLACVGIHTLFKEGMVLHRLEPIISGLPDMIAKPLCTCLPCMASVWTIVAFLITGHHLIHWHPIATPGQPPLFTLPLPAKDLVGAMLMVCGMNTTLDSLIQFFAIQPLPKYEP